MQSLSTVSIEMMSFIRGLESTPGFRIEQLKMQTTIHYKDVKVGGANNNHGYIARGVVEGNSLFEEELSALRFVRKSKPARSGHIHVWWQIPVSEVRSMQLAVEGAKKHIDSGKGN